MFTGHDLALELVKFFVTNNFSASSMPTDEKSGWISLMGKLELSFWMEPTTTLNIRLSSDYLSDYPNILENLDKFYGSLPKTIIDHRKNFAGYIDNSRLEKRDNPFEWRCSILDEDVSRVFGAVYDACIRPAFYLARNAPR